MLGILMLASGAMIVMAIAARRISNRVARRTGVAFHLAAASYTTRLWNSEADLLPAFIEIPALIMTVGTVGWFWLFAMALFEDADRFQPIRIITVALLTCVAVAQRIVPDAAAMFCWIIVNVIQLAMAGHVLVVVARGWKGDLVETRRHLRGPFLATVTTYILATRGFEFVEEFGIRPDWYPTANAIALMAISLAGAFILLDSRTDLFGANRTLISKRRSPASEETTTAPAGDATPVANGQVNGMIVNGLDRAAKADLDRLETLMASQQVWREEGLTIASLAQRSGIPEVSLRRLINEHLGYRNFPNYVNAHRIAAAKTRLADPNGARVSISSIAYELGFRSLAPFNRAFREHTGASPSEWRRNALHICPSVVEDA